MHALPRAAGGRLPDATLAAAGAPGVHSRAPATVGIHTQLHHTRRSRLFRASAGVAPEPLVERPGREAPSLGDNELR